MAAAGLLAPGAGAQDTLCRKPSDQRPPPGAVAEALPDARGETIDPVCVLNITTGPKTIAVQPGITVLIAAGFTGAIQGRLDSVRAEGGDGDAPTSLAALGSDGMMGLGAREKARAAARPGGPASPFSTYVMGTFQGGSSSDAPTLAGFDYDSTSGMAGVEVSVNRNLILGLAGSFTTTNADLSTGASIDADAIQGAAYLAYATRHWFVDALAAYGMVDLDGARTVATEVVRSSTEVSVVALAARGGYLFDLGKLRAGPIAGLTYLHGRIDGYTEEGNPSLTLTVGAQTVDSLAGSVGVRFLAPFKAGGNLVVPYLNVTWEHQFGDSVQSLTTSLSQTGAPVPLSFPAFDARDFGKIEGGLTVEFAPQASVTLNGASTFARDDAHDFRVSAGVNLRF